MRSLELIAALVDHLAPGAPSEAGSARPGTVTRTPSNQPVFNPRYATSGKAAKPSSAITTVGACNTQATWLKERSRQLAELEAELRSIRGAGGGGRRGPLLPRAAAAQGPSSARVTGNKRKSAAMEPFTGPKLNPQAKKQGAFIAKLSRFAAPASAARPAGQEARRAAAAQTPLPKDASLQLGRPTPARSAPRPAVTRRGRQAQDAFVGRMRKAQEAKAGATRR
jgi:hypothetical protein